VSEMHELAGAYALNALDAAELAEFENHLATCPVCQDDVTAFCETAAELSLLSLATPPPELRDNIMDAIQNVQQTPPADGSAPPAHGPAEVNGSRPAETTLRSVRGPRRALPGTEVPDGPDEPDEPGTDPAPRVDEVALRRQRRRARFLTGLVAAMLAVAVGLGGVVYTLVQDQRAQVASISLEQELYAAPDVELRDPITLNGGGTATFVFSRQLNRALFIATDLPDPGPDKRYQLWTMEGPEPKWKGAERVTRDTQITDRESAVKVFFRGDIAGSDFLCISIEPKDNLTDTPTVPPIGSIPV
jgi:Anti-sigma-K factor rskA/Putative zinc-finger